MIMQFLTKTKTVIDGILKVVCVAAFMILVIVVSWQVFARQVLDDPSQWSETLARYLFIWVGLLGAALVFGERGHIAIEVLVNRLPERVQKVLAYAVQLIVATFATYVLVWGGIRATENAWIQNLSGLPTPLGPWYLVLPISGVIVVFYSVFHMAALRRGEEDSFDTTPTDVV